MMKTNPLEAICAAERAYAAIPYVETGTNHQRFSDAVNAAGLAGCQNQAWCATYQFAVELETVGKAQALKNWNMTEADYCGYSCFETEAAFSRAGKTGNKPRLGALVVFRQSHMGRVLALSGDSFLCGEGNTSNAEFHRDGDACAVKTYKSNDPKIKSFCYINYGEIEMNASQLISACKGVYEMAHNGGYHYGDSHGVPPCSDGLISCDRLIARALWNLGYTEQPRGGITVLNMESYLLKWGFKKIQPNNALKAGDIVLMKRNGETTATANWHTFIVTAVTVSGSVTLINKYDMGGAVGDDSRIRAAQPFIGVPVNQWSNRSVYCFFRYGSAPKEYVFTPQVVKAGSTGASQYLANEIFLAHDIKGVNKNGKPQSLELNGTWTGGDMAAAAQWKLDRLRNGDANLCKGPYGAGEIGLPDWVSILMSALPFRCKPIPDSETHGPCVLLWQRLMRANGFKGADGKPLTLDATHGANTTYATKAWQKANGRPQTGKVEYEDWRIALKNI